MKHTLVAVFDNRTDAQKALEDLASSGFSRQCVRLSEGDTTGQTGISSSGTTGTTGTTARSDDMDDDGSFGASIRNFFGDLFGNDRSEDYRMYSEAVSRGNYVLTLDADSEPEVERAADIVERYGPIDIDEHAQQWGVMGQDSARMGSSGRQQSQSMSQQAALGSSQGLLGGQLQGSQLQGSQQYQDTASQRVGEGKSIPVIQEELKVGKREVQRGGVRVYNRLVETPVNETVGLREEHVNVERHAVDRQIDPADLNAFKETTIEMRETAEEAVVEKTARVVEEVVVDKQVTQHQQQINDTVRHTEVEVEQLSAEDDTYFRNHYQSSLASSGQRYEDYAPAYSYGNSMARSEMYRGRPWNDVEPELRSDWESRNSGSTWENMKAAVRHGWERMTS
ncbi:YsnF/AvaK domain-containing protein [Massilia sp. PAMC28688]|uniref:YsnF/AvaK domain-containing protein n=1 Tax=Massilia sp. PAMC28688 TaxID=2861283 RepID=UPI001C633E8B|nr:YsnF/AvaK domain-containing protein [Massilia sp. PAMC28688]QYF92937.1 YsnF/AvaK domain-containing protein [Massilia sp. PAMC28688]